MTSRVTMNNFDVSKLSLGDISCHDSYQSIPILYDGGPFFLETPELKSLGVYKNKYRGDAVGYSMALVCFENMDNKTADERRFYGVITEITNFIRDGIDKLRSQIRENGRKHPIDVDNLLMCKPNHRDPDKSPILWPKLLVDYPAKTAIKSDFKRKDGNKYVKVEGKHYRDKLCRVKASLKIDDVYIGSSNECIRFKIPRVLVASLIDTSEPYMGPEISTTATECGHQIIHEYIREHF